jgi:prolyl 4-hydroxylase
MTDPIAQVAMLAQTGRTEEALRLLAALGEQGEPMALATLADFYWAGHMLPQDPPRARDYYKRAGEAGHPRGRFTFTNLVSNGIYGERDWPLALARLRSEAADPARARAMALIDRMELTKTGDPTALPEPRRLSSAPEISLYAGLFTAAECDHLLAVAAPGYRPTTIVDPQGHEVPHPLRTSEGAPLHWLIEDPAVHALARRLAAVSGTDYHQGEPLIILRYRPGQQYHRHHDALPGLENQRIKTALVYLGDDYQGGETEFPRIGFKLRGNKGDVLVFRNVDENGQVDTLSEHAGLPVESGTKYLASRWIHARRHIP